MILNAKRYLSIMLIMALAACNSTATDKKDAGQGEQNAQTTELTPEPLATEKPAVTKNREMEVVASQDNPGSVTINVPDDDTKAKQQEELQAQQQDRETAFLFNKGTTAYSNEDYETGIGYFKQVLEKNPENRKAVYNLGVGYFELNKFSDALASFNKAIAMNPRDSLSIQYRGRVYYMLGDFEKCLKDYDLVVKMKPDDYISWYNRGTAKGQLHDYLGAIKDFDKAIEINPDYAEAYYNRGLANYYQGRRHEACYDWRKAHSLGHYQSEKALRSYCEDE